MKSKRILMVRERREEFAGYRVKRGKLFPVIAKNQNCCLGFSTSLGLLSTNGPVEPLGALT